MTIPLPQPAVGTARILDGKVALVTGSASGIGPGIVHASWHRHAFASAGASVVINGFGKPKKINDPLAGEQPSKCFATVEEIGPLATVLASDSGKRLWQTTPASDPGKPPRQATPPPRSRAPPCRSTAAGRLIEETPAHPG
ncbi:hypothetical protein [Microvirga sp. M2]|uniref:hypothetical protein n=1 Tax=Microvirga sp. M2 TaxID=3073270 RepID=UPI0039C41B7C